jgi:hypothetical protein
MIAYGTRRGWLKNGNQPGDPQVHFGARRLAGAMAVRCRPCRKVDAGCTGARAPAREPQKGWSGAARRI